ncbi:MAG: ABC transporter permease [Planctomycetes bacterium]|nr:ABC transporter permease [Planctomycetota bacterium]MBI3834903.1 ABC transporter permease [Planctomycetota bacterium]
MFALLSIPGRVANGISGIVARNIQNVSIAFVQIWANKGRAILTTLGIIIGVTSTITVVTFVQGFGNYITKMVQGYGTSFMVVRPFAPPTSQRMGMKRTTLDLADIEAVRKECQHVRRLTPFVFTDKIEVVYGQEKAKDVPCRGVTEQYQVIRNYYVDAGRFFGPMELETGAYSIVLGRSVLKQLQCDESIIGQRVEINGSRFLVTGLLQAKGSMFGEDQDMTVMIPYTTSLNLWPNKRDSMPFLVEAGNEAEIDEASGEIRRVLRIRHGLQHGQPDDFQLDRQDQALKQFATIRNAASGILAGIVSISLLVGGIGIMNIMLVSVTERTREIGLRKSIGARRRDILMQFLTEAVVLCVIGGVIGVFLAYSTVFVAAMHPKMVQVSVPLWSVALALICSAGAGMVFGIIPAFKAAILHPIEALRHE